ncbi:hypothetical protein GOEFS_093_00290 [Gordonia effusa NBRC 100432]|uniref:DUF5318 domain-containing protein n=1 Tax=Gordonia effusa NBRC 100432 TaxID=1077974 RepID=H0R3P9_9ACTN|nr:DUF5318 family protein [Gordonia effusa]GAB19700.1 hypothetical protein GOEFS_093_00290 [Gordonia effusa NBRC 100432]
MQPQGQASARREVIDYALTRKSVLSDVYAGRIAVGEVCDANPYLLRAAKFHGAASEITCPICRKEKVTLVSWIFGDKLGQASGSARSADELDRMAAVHEEFSVHVVEVCRTCHWNHLVQSFVLGLRPTRTRTRRVAK